MVKRISSHGAFHTFLSKLVSCFQSGVDGLEGVDFSYQDADGDEERRVMVQKFNSDVAVQALRNIAALVEDDKVFVAVLLSLHDSDTLQQSFDVAREWRIDGRRGDPANRR